MERLLITAILLAIPAYLYTWLVRNIDRFEKKTFPTLIDAFAWGSILAITFARIFQEILPIPITQNMGEVTLAGSWVKPLITVAVTEEILKGIVVAIIYLRCRREFDGWIDGIVYGATVGFGFAYVDNIFYLTNQTHTWGEWIQLFLSRSIVFGGIHGFWTALVGIGFGFARYRNNPVRKVMVISGGLIAAMLANIIHNGALITIQERSDLILLLALFNYIAMAVLTILLWSIAGYVDRQRLQTYLSEEVPEFISFECYEALCSFDKNVFASLAMSQEQRRELFKVATKLAQKKMELIKMGEVESNSVEISGLRQELRRLGNGDWGVSI